MLKRLFEYSNIFEQGFENEYSNTKIEIEYSKKRWIELRRRHCGKPSLRQPRRWSNRWSWTRTAVHDHEVTNESIPFDRLLFEISAVQCTKPRGKRQSTLDCVASVLVPRAFTGKCQAKGAMVCPVDLRIPWRYKLLLEERLAKMRWRVAGCASGWIPWTTSSLMSMRAHLFQVHPQVRRELEKVPWGWTPSTEWHCVSLVLICAAESDSTLYSLLATDRRSVGWPLASWQSYDMRVLHEISARLQETASALHLYGRTRHVGVRLKLELHHLGTNQRGSTWPCKNACWPATLNLICMQLSEARQEE